MPDLQRDMSVFMWYEIQYRHLKLDSCLKCMLNNDMLEKDKDISAYGCYSMRTYRITVIEKSYYTLCDYYR